MTELRYGVRMSLVVTDDDYAPTETYRHPTEPCHGCLRLVISGDAASRKPIVCEECLDYNNKFGSLVAVL